MKKLILLLAISLLTVSFSIAQTPHKVYCEIVGTSNLTGTKISRLEVDMGQCSTLGTYFNAHTLVDENNEKMKFNSMMDAMNYFGKYGWEFVQAFVVGTTPGNSVYHFVLSKEITNDEQIKEGIKLRE